MIVGIGTDVVEIHRIRDFAERHRESLGRIFAPCELHYCEGKRNPFPHLAARFAAKEAVFKALGSGWSIEVGWTDVAVRSDAAGRPEVELRGGAERLANRLGVRRIHLSLTHTRAYASAQVVMEG